MFVGRDRNTNVCVLYYMHEGCSPYVTYMCMLMYMYLSRSPSLPPSHRWTSLGLEFIILACALRQLALMSRTNFLSLRQLMNLTLDYVNREAVVIEGKRSKFQASQYTLYDIHESEQYTDSLYGSQHRVYGAHTSDLHTAGLRHSLTPHLYSSLSYDTSENRSLSTPRRFSRSLSGGLALLSSGNEGDRLANIQKKIRLLELVSERGRERGRGREGEGEGEREREEREGEVERACIPEQLLALSSYFHLLYLQVVVSQCTYDNTHSIITYSGLLL